METFYRFLGGPRTFWGNSNRTIINNNFIGTTPMMPTFNHNMPIFGGHHCCGGGSNLFNWMLGFGLASSIVGGIFGNANQTNATINYNNSYNPYPIYPQTPYNPYFNNNSNYSNQDLSSLTAKVNKLEDDLESYKKTLDQLATTQNQKNENIAEQPKINNQETNKTEEKKKKETNVQEPKTQQQPNTTKENKNLEKSTNTNKPEKVKTESNTNNQGISSNTQNNNKEKTLDDILNEAGFNNLDTTAKNYVKSRITQVYTDQNGNIKYDIKAVVHDGDNLNSIIDRFYTKEEKENLEVAKAKFNTQGSETKLIVNPLSGDTITANGVSEYGLKALMQDAQKGITRQGEITKTNKRIADLKAAFINGDKKLSKAYVIQNKLMTENEYNKIIQEKYS